MENERESQDEIFPQTWVTNETPPRILKAKGRSALRNDCIVAYLENGKKALWIDTGGTKNSTKSCIVHGIHKNGDWVRAQRCE